MQVLTVAPRFWGVIVAVSIVLGVAGPFDTYEHLALAPRLAYWFATALATFLAGYLSIGLLFHFLLGDVGNRPVRIALAGLTAGLPVTAIVVLLNKAIFHEPTTATGDILTLYVNCSLIAGAVTVLFGLIDNGQPAASTASAPAISSPTVPLSEEPSPGSAVAAKARPKLLDRLPPHLRGDVTYLSMQDHYVDVHTEKGSTLVLMRLADAIAELEGVPGLQIHRSHWVALDAVAGSLSRDGRLFLRMSDETLLPVSRSWLEAVRAAGLA
ncbi:LytTR family DNA-binding domain-containing protein [Mesorhizobium sp. L-8-3]|uniref:LytTR family DNA-binding domain-containing protein n=1 Tax=Mesorhizobium sp. L-8-3 TaxID=2744522 RepID=UPI001927D06B|nr:LytTR family DNA-binding domain-containing protein [Mesorhizobium sp. L-8-3]BCH28021.1 hypothetical protein MesoLjLb_78060 [Mesorhizobium sp. L-8-3]